MNSISTHLRPADFVAQIRLERQSHRGAFVLLEGATDSRRLSKFLDQPTCSTIICFGKDNVLGTIELMQEVGFEDCLGFVDADFDRVLQKYQPNEDVVHSTHHDFDLDMTASPAIDRYLNEVADAQKLEAVGGSAAFLSDLLTQLKPLSVMRLANVKHQLRYNLSRIDIAAFFDGAAIDIDRMIDHVSDGKFSSAEHKEALRGHIEHYQAIDFDLGQLTCGHDVMAAVGIALRGRIGSRRDNQTWQSEVEMHLRLTYDLTDLDYTGLRQAVLNWQKSRAGMKVLHEN